MKKIKLTIIAALALISTTNAQLKTPQPSPAGEVEQTVGLTEVEVKYSRPGMKDRKIFGELIPFGELWRTGANASTKISFDNDVKINNQDLKAGTYSIFTIPGEKEWTVIFNTNLELWGNDGYKDSDDALRVTVQPTKLNDVVETMTFDFSNLTSSGAKLNLKWENTLVSLDIETNAKKMVEEQINTMLVEGPSAGTYFAAARFYLENDGDLNQALTWINIAIEKRPNAFWYMYQKANILAKLGKNKEAIETATKSIELAKANADGDYGYVKRNEDLISELKTK